MIIRPVLLAAMAAMPIAARVGFIWRGVKSFSSRSAPTTKQHLA